MHFVAQILLFVQEIVDTVSGAGYGYLQSICGVNQGDVGIAVSNQETEGASIVVS